MAGYACNFDLWLNTDKEPLEQRNNSCFRMFYDSIPNHTKVIIYILKEYKGSQADRNRCIFNREELVKYFDALKEIGFNFKLEDGICIINTSNDPYCKNLEEVESYNVQINFSENSTISNKILLNAIRYTYEHYEIPYPSTIGKYFFEFINMQGNTSMYNRFILAHMKLHESSGHNIIPYPGNNYMNLLSQEELEKKIIKSTENPSYISNYLKGINVSIRNDDKLNKLFSKDLTIDQIEEEYKQLCKI